MHHENRGNRIYWGPSFESPTTFWENTTPNKTTGQENRYTFHWALGIGAFAEDWPLPQPGFGQIPYMGMEKVPKMSIDMALELSEHHACQYKIMGYFPHFRGRAPYLTNLDYI